MTHAPLATLLVLGATIAHAPIAVGQPFPSSGSPNPAMTGAPAAAPAPSAPIPTATAPAPARPSAPATSAPSLPSSAMPAAASGGQSASGVPRAVAVARATSIPNCTVFVDGAAGAGGNGTVQRPHKTIAAAVAAARPGAVVCVTEGTYAEALAPGEKHFTLAGGFQRGKDFKVRDSAAYVSKASGRGGSFLRIQDPGPKDGALTAVDGFEITGYSQAIVREFYEPQRFDITNNYIHDNKCADDKLVGAGFSLTNVSGTIRGNVIRKNSCGRGGAGAYVDDVDKNKLLVADNLVEGNAGTASDSHGGGLYLFGKELTITGNAFVGNTVTQWGGGLFVGAYTPGGQHTNATLRWNIYRDNRAGNSGGGFFCDEAATCVSEHEIYVANCGGNILVDSGQDESDPSVATFDHVTIVGALDPSCKAPGDGVLITKGSLPLHTFTFRNALFWGNAPGRDFAVFCDKGCDKLKVSVAHSMVQTTYAKQNASVAFGPGIMTPADPLFADVDKGDFHLKSAAGRWTAAGHVKDPVTSPAIDKGTPRTTPDTNPDRVGQRNEFGAYGNSGEASYAR
jgi:hypothetical protein